MVYSFVLLNGVGLPIFTNKLGSTTDFNICLDTGCGLTTLYLDNETVKLLYPDAKKANISVEMKNADGDVCTTEVYIIPTFVLVDNNNEKLIVKNLYCIISDAEMDNIDILLSGNVFFNTSLTITPNKIDDNPQRVIRVDTLRDNRHFLFMEPAKDKSDKIIGYPAFLRKIDM